jgi:hypothetical protein
MAESPIRLTAGASGDTALVEDARCGFSFAVPGHPVLEPAPGGGAPRQGQAGAETAPAFDAALLVSDLGVRIRLRLDLLPMASPRPSALAAALAQTYAKNRTASEVHVTVADAARINLWGASGAASSLYTLPRTGGDDCDVEEVLALVRPSLPSNTWAVYLTKRFASRDLGGLQWAVFNAAVAGSIRWDPARPERAVPVLYPPSAIVGDGLPLRLTPEWAERVGAFAAELVQAASAPELAEIGKKLARLASGSDPPSERVDPARRDVYRQFLGSIAPSEDVRSLLARRLDDVHSAHDLRGYTLFCLQAIARATSAAAGSA